MKDKYRRRQALVKHPFGVLKRQWGYDHFLVKGLSNVETELGLMFTDYNLRRLITIFGSKELIKRLLRFFDIKWFIFRPYKPIMYFHNIFKPKRTPCQTSEYSLYLNHHKIKF
ncbi:MAG: transposase [Bacteroidales bacterium]|nr:transposase [Bacteroidales bacterium]MCF8404364.1 transposase [Bacteroidales bacterium]